jgi:hypothetical protein
MVAPLSYSILESLLSDCSDGLATQSRLPVLASVILNIRAPSRRCDYLPLQAVHGAHHSHPLGGGRAAAIASQLLL